MPASARWRLFLLVTLALALSRAALADEPKDPRRNELEALINAGKYAEAESGARALLAEVEAAHGADAIQVAFALDTLVASLSYGNQPADAERRSLAERSLAIKERVLGPDDLEVATSLHLLANLHLAAADFSGARPLYERALAIREKALGPENPAVADTLATFASLLFDTGEYAAALPLNERALAIREKALGPGHPLVAASLNNIANLHAVMGDFGEARAAQERAIAIREKALGPDHPDLAKSLGNMANLLDIMGDYAAARSMYERALAIFDKALGPGNSFSATHMNNLAGTLESMGDYAGARALYERTLDIREKSLRPDHPDVAQSLMNLANLLTTTGDGAAARPFAERAVAIDEKALGPDHPDVAVALGMLAQTLEPVAAHGLLERALAIKEKALGPDHPSVADTLDSLSQLDQSTNDYAAARRVQERALAIREKAFGPDHPGLAWGLDNLAISLTETGDVAAARPLLERAVHLVETSVGEGSPELASDLSDLARVRAIQSDVSGALGSALRAERIARDHLRLTAASLSERQALRYAATRPSGLDLALTLAARGLEPASRRQVLDAAVRSRAVVLDEIAARHRAIGGNADPAVAQLVKDLASSGARLANLLVRGPGDQEPATYRRLLEDARHETERKESALAAASAAFTRDLTRSRLGLEEVAANLPPRSALVSFLLYKRADLNPGRSGSPSARPSDHAGDVPSYLALVLRSGDAAPQVVDLGPAGEVDRLVRRWKDEASGRRSGLGAPGEAAYREAGAALRAAVWDPVSRAIGDSERAFVVPDGTLNLVNLASLPLGRDGYLVERGPVVHILSDERDLVGSDDPRHGQGLLAVGGANYDASTPFGSLAKPPAAKPKSGDAPVVLASATTYRGPHASCNDFASVHFEPLPATARETREIAREWRKQGKGDAAVVLDLHDAAASETDLKRLAPGHRVLHLATHGFILGGDCKSALASARGIGALSEAPASGPKSEAAPIDGENPLLLSGLALAGANHRGAAAEGEDDGILTAEEVASLDLTGVEWAVLSACETGLGDVQAGEGVFGLRRAFQVAGAASLIMSLWSVDDEATRAWMSALYKGRLERHLDTAQAVHDASLTLLNQRRAAGLSTHPFYWAAFVAAGDWR